MKEERCGCRCATRLDYNIRRVDGALEKIGCNRADIRSLMLTQHLLMLVAAVFMCASSAFAVWLLL